LALAALALMTATRKFVMEICWRYKLGESLTGWSLNGILTQSYVTKPNVIKNNIFTELFRCSLVGLTGRVVLVGQVATLFTSFNFWERYSLIRGNEH